ncbi:MAG: hypothetical protein H0T43_09720 [Solirubrobacterales bacterium]|nr:hypothetical protein [Solirubrobacterales bacterium]
MKLGRPSPALVVATIALVVALGGTGYAQVQRITKSNQIKNGVVTGAKIRDGSVTGKDVKKGALTLSKLSAGTQRIIRRSGSGGAVGGVVAMEAFRKAGPENQPANVVVKVASLTVPAGVYQVSAKTVMTAIGGDTNLFETLADAPASIGGHCKLDTAPDVDESTAPIVIRNRPSPSTLYMQLTRTVGGSTTFDLLCDAGAPWRTSDTSIIATKIASASRTEASGS